MKNKKLLLTISVILPVLLISLMAIFSLPVKKELSEREKYEQFLNNEYKNIPNCSEEELKDVPGVNHPDLAAIQNYFMTLDPELGRVPVERLKEAYKQTKAIREQSKLKSGAMSMEWEGTGAVMGGRARALMFDPNDNTNNKVWSGGVTGGLWYNNDITDEDSQWVPVDDFWSSLSISCITYDPSDPQIFYVGTGEVQTAFSTYRESSGVGVGIFRSTNGGNNWQLIPSTEDFKYITEIAVRNENSVSVIYAGVASGFYHGEDHQSLPTDGLYRSDDNGQTWEQVLPNITDENIPYAVSNVKIGVDGRIYVGTIQNIDGNGGATILYSDDGTAGSWTVYEDYRIIIENHGSYYLPGRVIIACAPSDENIVFAFLAAGFTSGFNYYHGRYILRSEDKGVTWESINKPTSGDWAYLAWHAFIGVVDPNDPTNLYVGGLDVWKTINTGITWNHVSDWALMYWGGGDEYVHADQHAQLYKPGSPEEMIFATDGGIFYTADGSSSSPVFQERNNNFNTLQFYTCAISPVAGEEKYVGGLQDNGTLYYTGSPLSIFDMIDGGDGAYCFIDQNEPPIMITSVYYNRYTVFLNGTQTNYIGDYQSGIFINPADYDYNLNTIYANAISFSGSQSNRILRITNILGNENGEYIWLPTATTVYFSHVKYSPHSPEETTTLFLGTNSGRLFKIENAQDGPVTTEIGSEYFPTGSISCIATGGSDDTLLVTFSNYGVSSVWQTYNGGETWQEKEGNLPDMPIRWAIYHPQNSQQAVLATEIGVWTTNELGMYPTNWEPVIDGLANVRVDMLKLREADNTVLAATHGRGLFTTTFEYDPYTSIGELPENILNTQVYPNPSDGIFNISFNVEKTNNIEIKIIDLTGRTVFTDNQNNYSGIYKKQIDISSFAKGTYILNIKSGNKIKTEKIVLN